MLILLASEHDDINVVGANEKIFYYENELFRIKINQKSLFCFFKTSHSHRSYPVLYMHKWSISNQLFNF